MTLNESVSERLSYTVQKKGCTHAKIHRMSSTNRISMHRLDVPEDPLIFFVDLEHVQLIFERKVAILDILERRLTPVDTGIRTIDEPLNQVTVNGGHIEVHLKSTDGISELDLGHLVQCVGYNALVVSCGGLRDGVLCRRLLLWGTLVSDD
jgi:hypothetical protein